MPKRSAGPPGPRRLWTAQPAGALCAPSPASSQAPERSGSGRPRPPARKSPGMRQSSRLQCLWKRRHLRSRSWHPGTIQLPAYRGTQPLESVPAWMAVRHPHSTASHACIIRMPPMPMRPSARQLPRRRSQILGLKDGRRGWICPEGRSA